MSLFNPVAPPVQRKPFLREISPDAAEAPSRFPLDNPTGPTGREAARLHAAWCEKAENIKQIRAAVDKRKAEVGVLERDLEAEQLRAAEAGDASLDRAQKLYDEIMSFGRELRELHAPRIEAARDVARRAAREYRSYLSQHEAELVHELIPTARAAQVAFTKLREKHAEEMRPVAAALTAARQAVIALTPSLSFNGETLPEHPEHWPEYLGLDFEEPEAASPAEVPARG